MELGTKVPGGVEGYWDPEYPMRHSHYWMITSALCAAIITGAFSFLWPNAHWLAHLIVFTVAFAVSYESAVAHAADEKILDKN